MTFGTAKRAKVRVVVFRWLRETNVLAAITWSGKQLDTIPLAGCFSMAAGTHGTYLRSGK